MDGPSLIGEPSLVEWATCAGVILESLVAPFDKEPGRSLTVTATPWRSRILSGLHPLAAAAPAALAPSELGFGNRDGAHETILKESS